jgi:hypothetical protein
VAPWDGTGVMNKKQTNEILQLAKLIGGAAPHLQKDLFKVKILLIYFQMLKYLVTRV